MFLELTLRTSCHQAAFICWSCRWSNSWIFLSGFTSGCCVTLSQGLKQHVPGKVVWQQTGQEACYWVRAVNWHCTSHIWPTLHSTWPGWAALSVSGVSSRRLMRRLMRTAMRFIWFIVKWCRFELLCCFEGTFYYSAVCFDVWVPPVWPAWRRKPREDPLKCSLTQWHTHTVRVHTCTHNGDLLMVCGQPISGTKAHVSLFISGFAQRQPNLDISHKARLLTAPLVPHSRSLSHIHSHICMLFEEAAVLIQKPELWEKGIEEANDWRDRISQKPGERGRGVWVRKVPRRSLSLPCFFKALILLWSCSPKS